MTKAKETAKKKGAKMPTDHKEAEKPFKEYPGAEHFRPLNEVDPIDAMELVADIEDLDSTAAPSLKEIKPLFKKIATETFIKDVEAFRREFYNAANLNQAVETTLAYVAEMGKGVSSNSSSPTTQS